MMDPLTEDDTNGNNFNTGAILFDESRLSYIGQDCRRVPPVLHNLYGDRTRRLDVSYNCLTSLVGVEQFVHLEELVLDNNCLTDNMRIPPLPLLHTLSLNKNNICNLELLLCQLSHSLPTLRYLSLLGNSACPDQLSDSDTDEQDYRAYRMYVLYRLPSLCFLDSTAVSPKERDEAGRRGKFMKVHRPNTSSHFDQPNIPMAVDPLEALYTPLPDSQRAAGNHIGAYSKCRYHYSGKHSEGNRFIQNNDL